MVIKAGKGITFKDCEEASYFFGWDCHKNIKGRPTKNAKTFRIEGDYFAWFPHNVTGERYEGWINELKSETEITVEKEKWKEAEIKKREDDDEPRKFVTFAKINEQKEYEFIGIFKLDSRDGNKLVYKRTFNGFSENKKTSLNFAELNL
jgi:hypothetical protein